MIPATWSYDPEANPRDLRLDLLRGLCLFKMVLNHLWTTPLDGVHRWIGFLSAAEGFFFLSGVIVSVVYGRRAERDGLPAACRGLLARAGQIYLANLGLVFFVAALEARRLLPRRFIVEGLAVEGWRSLFGLNQVHYYLHVLPRYVVFLALAPVALWLLRRRRGGALVVFATAIWAANLITRGALILPGAEARDQVPFSFPVASWQLLFFLGMAMGFHRRRVAAWWRRSVSPGWVAGFAVVALGMVWFAHELAVGRLVVGYDATQLWLARPFVAPVRVINLAAGFALLFWLTDRCWQPVSRLVGWLLLPFGQHALYLYLLHVLVYVLGSVWLAQTSIPLNGEGWQTLPIVIAAISMFWLMIRHRVGFRYIPS